MLEDIPFEEYMSEKEDMPPQTREILKMSKKEIEGAIDNLFELCKPRPEDLEIVEALATMYGVRKRIYIKDETNIFKTNYVVNFMEKNGDKGMVVKNSKDNRFFSREEVKFHISFILGFQLQLDGKGWMLIEEIFDRMFEEKDALNPISKIIAEIKDDLLSEGFNKNMVEDNGFKTEYRLSTKPYLISIDTANRYIRLWFFNIGYKEITKVNVRKKKKDAFDRLKKIGGEEFYELFRED